MSARYNFKVGPINRHSGYAHPVTVIADSFPEAKRKAIEFAGWAPRDSGVWFLSVEEIPAKQETSE